MCVTQGRIPGGVGWCVCVTQGRIPGGVRWGVCVTQGRIPGGVGWGGCVTQGRIPGGVVQLHVRTTNIRTCYRSHDLPPPTGFTFLENNVRREG